MNQEENNEQETRLKRAKKTIANPPTKTKSRRKMHRMVPNRTGESAPTHMKSTRTDKIRREKRNAAKEAATHEAAAPKDTKNPIVEEENHSQENN